LFLYGQLRPYPKGRNTSIPTFGGGASYMHAHGMRYNNQILHGDQTRCEENVCWVDHEC